MPTTCCLFNTLKISHPEYTNYFLLWIYKPVSLKGISCNIQVLYIFLKLQFKPEWAMHGHSTIGVLLCIQKYCWKYNKIYTLIIEYWNSSNYFPQALSFIFCCCNRRSWLQLIERDGGCEWTRCASFFFVQS